MNHPSQHICLNMIVKNEAHVITRCLKSVKSLISSWAIVDTGSNDGTQEIIKSYMSDLPGQLVERPWVDFAYNRSEALNYVTKDADYILIVDADEEMKTDPGFILPQLDLDCYYIQTRLGYLNYFRMQLVKNGLNWRWESKLHEYITSDQIKTNGYLEGIYDLPHPDGYRSSNPHKYKQDALTLEQALLEEPDNPRYTFYLAQSYRDCNDIDLALRYYTKRVAMKGWEEEVWYSLYQIGLLKAKKDEPWEIVQMALLDAYNYRPSRAESLIPIIEFYKDKQAWALAYLFVKQVVGISIPNDLIFIEPAAYAPTIWIAYAQAANGCGFFDQAMAACTVVINHKASSADTMQQAIALRSSAQDAFFQHTNIEVTQQKQIHILLVCDQLNPSFDNCMSSLLQQHYSNFNISCIVPEAMLEEARQYLRNITHPTLQVLSRKDVAQLFNTDSHNEIYLTFSGQSWLNFPTALESINKLFQNGKIAALHGTFLHSDGKYGKGAPDISYTQLDALGELDSKDHWIAFRSEAFGSIEEDRLVNINVLCNYLLTEINANGLKSYFLEKPLVTIQ